MERADDETVAAKLSEAAAASIDWATNNGVEFDKGKTEAAIFRRRKTAPVATVKVGANTVPFNKEAARWLGIWQDSQLLPTDHLDIRLKDGNRAMARLHRLTGQMGLSPANCRKVMGLHHPSKLTAAVGQPGDKSDDRILPDNQHRGTVNGIGHQWRRHSWKTDSGGSRYGYSACRWEIRCRKLSRRRR